MPKSSKSEKISVVFVLEDGVDKSSVSKDMQAAHQCCTDQEASTAWISSEECFKLSPKKTDIYVFEQFEGSAFEFLKKFKCVIISPRCLMTCLVERKPIPNIPSPIFTIAMVGVVATASGLTKEKKKNLNEKINLMGGIYLNAFSASVTHLIADGVGSQKYKVAAERNVPIMTEEWVLAVWEASVVENVSALDPQFSNHKLPVFKGMLICASQIPKRDKQTLMKTINNNGGRYSPQLECKETGVLVIGDPSGEKYTYAKKWGIPCVTPKWVFDSIAKGCALPFDNYPLDEEKSRQAKCSTPTHGRNLDTLPDFSMCSTIVGEASHLYVNETSYGEISAAQEPRTPKKGNGGSKEYIELVNKLDPLEAKKAGTFLDGCKVYLSGFSPSQVEKLRKIINGGGATRFHQITESISHVIVGEFNYEEMKALKSAKFRPFVVTVEWLLESISLGRVADEEKFLCFDLKPLEPPSPLSKKGLQLLQGGSVSQSPVVLSKASRVEANGMENISDPANSKKDQDIVQQYLGDQENLCPDVGVVNQENLVQNIPLEYNNVDADNAPELPIQEAVSSTSDGKVFQGLAFMVAGFDKDPDEEDVGEEVQQMLIALGGKVMDKRSRGIPDYGIVPIEGGQLPCTVGEVVTHLWLEDCHEQGKVLPVEYYHRPLSVEPNCKALRGCVIGISSYVGKERFFIASLAESMGAYSQEVFSKKNIPEKNAVASTHLICPTPEGSKYAASVKWGLPAVTKEWILACAQKRQKVPEADYCVSKSSKNSISKTPGKSMGTSDILKESVMENKIAPVGSGSAQSDLKATVQNAEVEVEKMPTNQSISTTNQKTSAGDDGSVAHAGSRTPVTTKLSASSTRAGSGRSDSSSGKLVDPKLDELKDAGDSYAGYMFTPPRPVRCDLGIRGGGARSSGVGDPMQVENHVRNDLDVSKGEGREEDEGKGRVQSAPGTPYGQIFEPNPSKSTRKAWKNWVDNIPRLHKPTPPKEAKDPETPLSELKRRLVASINRKCEQLEMKWKDGDDAEGGAPQETAFASSKRKRADEPDEPSKRSAMPFVGVVAYIWKEFPKAEREKLSAKIENLGGIVQNSYSDIITHAIFQGEECAVSEVYKCAQNDGKILVAPHWVDICTSEGRLLDESLFPPSDFPTGSSFNWESLKTQPIGIPPQKLANLMSSHETALERLHGTSSNPSEEPAKALRKPEVHLQLKKLDHVLAEEIQSTPDKLRLSRAANNAALRGSRESSVPESVTSNCHMANRSPGASGSGYHANPLSPCTQRSSSEIISWQENGCSEEEIVKPIKVTKPVRVRPKKPPMFMFSGMEDGDRAMYGELINELGGSVSGDPNFDSNATHLITLRPARSEKLLGSIASGKWVLHPQYLKASKLEGRFVEEEPYEWGNPDGFIPLPTVEIERILSESAHRWRIKLKDSLESESDASPSNGLRGAFEGVCAIVHMTEERSAAFRRLIVAGGGTISTAKPPYSSVSDATLCLMEPGRSPVGSVDIEALAKKGIPCLKPLYLNECLIRVAAPEPVEFAVPLYLAALRALGK